MFSVGCLRPFALASLGRTAAVPCSVRAYSKRIKMLNAARKEARQPKLRGNPTRDSPDVQISKTLSYLLRHGAQKERLPIRPDGFVRVRDLLAHDRLRGVTFQKLDELVAKDSKGRYKLVQEPDLDAADGTADGWWIRANQGHSLKDLEVHYDPLTDPTQVPMAVHGTNKRAWGLISEQGLSRMNRTHIHMAQGVPGSGVISGMRNTADVIVHVDLERALAAGLQFFLSANGVVLSPGDERGFISPEFFSRVEDRKGHPLPGWIPKPSEPSVASVSETAAPKPLAAEEKKKIKEAVTAS